MLSCWCFFLLQLAFWILIRGALCCVCIFAPFLVFQGYGYYNICVGQQTDEMSPWCKARIPLLYSYIQSHYWYVPTPEFSFLHILKLLKELLPSAPWNFRILPPSAADSLHFKCFIREAHSLRKLHKWCYIEDKIREADLGGLGM